MGWWGSDDFLGDDPGWGAGDSSLDPSGDLSTATLLFPQYGTTGNFGGDGPLFQILPTDLPLDDTARVWHDCGDGLELGEVGSCFPSGGGGRGGGGSAQSSAAGAGWLGGFFGGILRGFSGGGVTQASARRMAPAGYAYDASGRLIKVSGGSSAGLGGMLPILLIGGLVLFLVLKK